VDQHERRPAAGRPEEDAVAVEGDLAQLVARGGHQRAAIRETVRKWTPSRPSSGEPHGRAVGDVEDERRSAPALVLV
jgi:hypothetical protein